MVAVTVALAAARVVVTTASIVVLTPPVDWIKYVRLTDDSTFGRKAEIVTGAVPVTRAADAPAPDVTLDAGADDDPGPEDDDEAAAEEPDPPVRALQL